MLGETYYFSTNKVNWEEEEEEPFLKKKKELLKKWPGPPGVLLSTSRRNITMVAEANARGRKTSSTIRRGLIKVLATPLFSVLVLSLPSSHLFWLVKIIIKKKTRSLFCQKKKHISLLQNRKQTVVLFKLSSHTDVNNDILNYKINFYINGSFRKQSFEVSQ